MLNLDPARAHPIPAGRERHQETETHHVALNCMDGCCSRLDGRYFGSDSSIDSEWMCEESLSSSQSAQLTRE